MRRMFTAWVLGLCAIGAQAQILGLEDRSGEATLACLVRPAPPPKYTADALAGRRDGFYRIELTFRDAQSPPDVKVAFSRGPEDLRQAAEQYAQQFRLPCLPAGQKVSALQEIAFNAVGAGDVQAPQPLNLPLPADARHAACLKRPTEPFQPGGATSGGPFLSGTTDGNVVLELSFTAPDQPPQAKVLYASTHRDHRDRFLAYVETFRVPCLLPGERFVMEQRLHMLMTGNARLSFKDLDLVKFLRMVRNAEAKPVNFNLDTMACPFRVKFNLRRPALANRVTEVGDSNPNRRSFIAWLEELELTLTKAQFESLLGVEMLIDVPCGAIQLG